MVSLPLTPPPEYARRTMPLPVPGACGQPLRWPDDPAPRHSGLCVILAPCAKAGFSDLLQTNRIQRKWCNLTHWVIKRLWLPFWGSPVLSLRFLALRKVSCHVVNLFKETPMWIGNEVSAASQEEFRPVGCPVSELRASPSQPGDDPSLGQCSLQSHEWPWARATQLSSSQILTCRNYGMYVCSHQCWGNLLCSGG